MDWFHGEHLNRKPSIFSLIWWGFPEIHWTINSCVPTEVDGLTSHVAVYQARLGRPRCWVGGGGRARPWPRGGTVWKSVCKMMSFIVLFCSNQSYLYYNLTYYICIIYIICIHNFWFPLWFLVDMLTELQHVLKALRRLLPTGSPCAHALWCESVRFMMVAHGDGSKPMKLPYFGEWPSRKTSYDYDPLGSVWVAFGKRLGPWPIGPYGNQRPKLRPEVQPGSGHWDIEKPAGSSCADSRVIRSAVAVTIWGFHDVP